MDDDDSCEQEEAQEGGTQDGVVEGGGGAGLAAALRLQQVQDLPDRLVPLPHLPPQRARPRLCWIPHLTVVVVAVVVVVVDVDVVVVVARSTPDCDWAPTLGPTLPHTGRLTLAGAGWRLGRDSHRRSAIHVSPPRNHSYSHWKSGPRPSGALPDREQLQRKDNLNFYDQDLRICLCFIPNLNLNRNQKKLSIINYLICFGFLGVDI